MAWRRTGGLLLALLLCLAAGCTSLRQMGDLESENLRETETSVLIAKGVQPRPPVTGPAVVEDPPRGTIDIETPEQVETKIVPAPGGASDALGSDTGAVESALEGILQQGAAAPSQEASQSAAWQGVMRGLSTVLQSKDAGAEGRVTVPEPTQRTMQQTEPSGPMIEAEVQHGTPVPEEGAAGESAGAWQGESVPPPSGFAPIDMHLNGVSARQALEMLSREAKVSVLVAQGVSGTVTANLRGMNFEEALNAIMRLCDLVAHREGETIFVYAAKDLPMLDRALRVFPLNYASADDVVSSIKAIQGMLSQVGTAYAMRTDDKDPRKTQEAIVVEDSPAHLFRIERYLQEIDIPPRQVQIQAYILEVTLKDDLVHGVNFEEVIKIAGNTATLQTLGFADPKATQAFFARIDGKNFDALLEALKTTTDAKTLANPKVTVLNGQLAHVQIGEKLGYRDTTTQTETAATQAVEFLDLGVVLDVIPWITEDGRILMNVYPQISSGRINPVTELPEEETTEVQTNVMLSDGEGIVIGGLIQEKDSDIQHKIPFLGNLPYVGMLFQERKRETQRKEVIIALIPRLLPYAPCPAAKDQLETIRATTPLFHGPLRRCPRPWEPSLRDALPNRGDRL